MRNIVRRPVRGEDFFERPKLINKIRKTLDAKLPILLSGPIKSGKTSILFYLMDNLNENYHFAYIDVGFISNIYEYYYTIHEKIGKMAIFKRFYKELTEPASTGDIIELLSTHKDEKPLVILIDNFSDVLKNIYKNGGPEDQRRLLNLNRELRNLVESNHNNVVFIYSDSLDLKKLQIL